MRRAGLLAMLLSSLILSGCQHERRQITPTTQGTDLKQMPRGQMTPFPWPGQSIVKAPSASRSDRDPAASLTSGEVEVEAR